MVTALDPRYCDSHRDDDPQFVDHPMIYEHPRDGYLPWDGYLGIMTILG